MLHVGTSGWQYPHWRGTFYPQRLPQREWLDWYCARFSTVEVNNTFYNLPAPATFDAWRERTPDGFLLAVKMSRFLTHVKRLRDAGEIVENFMERALRLRPKLGPVLVQLPPRFGVDVDRLDGVLRALGRWPSVRVAVEFRDQSWYTDEVRQLLESHGAALVLADSRRRAQPHWRTADWGFVRFHEGRASPRPCYGERALATWAERVASLWKPSEDVYCFFNNDTRACALRDAVVFARLAGKAGLPVSRVPRRDEVSVLA